MIMKNPEMKEEVLIKLAEEICLAVRTAPKAKGLDKPAQEIQKQSPL